MRTRRAFTLVEILVVIAIILLVTVIAAPVIYTALNGRQVTDAARIFTGALAGIRDAAIKNNEPRGLRLLPDPLMTLPAPGALSSGTTQLVYNRMVPIEPAGDYSEGKINVGPKLAANHPGLTGFPTPYPRDVAGTTYPYWPTGFTPTVAAVGTEGEVLMVEESLIGGGFTFISGMGNGGVPNSPTNWWWTIRVGDKIKINGTGRAYTIVGPLTISPWGTGANQGNYELFVNAGLPGTASPLIRSYYRTTSTSPLGFTFVTTGRPQFLFVVDGDDDNSDGFVDEGFDGFDNPRYIPNPNPPPDLLAVYEGVDTIREWETEKWTSSMGGSLGDPGDASSGESPTLEWLTANWQSNVQDLGHDER